MKSRIDISLHSDFSPETCLARLTEQIDVDRFTLFSLSGYGGSQPILGRVAGNEFRLHKRRYWHNSFGPVLFGRVVPDGRGSAIEAYWDMWLGPRIFMRIWLAIAIVIGLPIFLTTLRDMFRGWPAAGDDWVGVIVPVALVLSGLLLPRIGEALSLHERKPIVDLVERTMVAGPKPMPVNRRTWTTALNRWMG